MISIMILGLLGLVFLRQYYIKHIHASRLARAGVLTYAMIGCDKREPPLLPRDWIGVKDLAKLTPESQNPPNNTTVPNDTGRTGSGNKTDKGDEVFGASGALKPEDGIANPIAQTGMLGKASVTKERAVVGTPPSFFERTARSRAFVSCGDEIREGSFGEVLDQVAGMIFP